ncbi:MAG: F0F1 ATP synthase subunit delta [Clostridiales bacterium]|nr:F0F1 ATP synthase subunit delta [Clostridiales bacterium]
MAKLVAKTYSQALFEFALESDSLNSINEEFEFVVNSFKTYNEFFELFKSPKISIEDRKRIIREVFQEKISTGMLNFILIILDKRRSSEIINIDYEFKKLFDKHFGIAKAYVKSVKELDENEKSELVKKLSELTGKEIHLKTSIDPEMIGGVYIKIGDKVIDGSIRNKLNEIKEELKQIKV